MQTKFWSENVKRRDHSRRTRHRREDNIRMDLRETVWGGVNCMHLV
jgi:hypothetical protein